MALYLLHHTDSDSWFVCLQMGQGFYCWIVTTDILSLAKLDLLVLGANLRISISWLIHVLDGQGHYISRVETPKPDIKHIGGFIMGLEMKQF